LYPSKPYSNQTLDDELMHHMRFNSLRNGATPNDRGVNGKIQVSQRSFSSFGRQSTSSFPKQQKPSSRRLSFESCACIFQGESPLQCITVVVEREMVQLLATVK